MKRAMLQGAIAGLIVGSMALVGALAAVGQCLPFRISMLPSPWPWYCNDPVFSMVEYLAFPVNLLTNDLARAIPLAPLALAVYMLIGAFMGRALSASRSSSSRKSRTGKPRWRR